MFARMLRVLLVASFSGKQSLLKKQRLPGSHAEGARHRRHSTAGNAEVKVYGSSFPWLGVKL